MITDVYNGCFNRIYMFSSSVDIDHTWQPGKDYITKEMKPNEKENVCLHSYEPAELEAIMDKQHKVIDYLKNHKVLRTCFKF